MSPEEWVRMGDRIRRIRTRKRISIGEMVERTGFVRSYLQAIENGEKKPALQTIVIIAVVLKTSLDYLIMGISPIPGVGDGKVRLRCDEAAQEIEEAQDGGEEESCDELP